MLSGHVAIVLINRGIIVIAITIVYNIVVVMRIVDDMCVFGVVAGSDRFTDVVACIV